MIRRFLPIVLASILVSPSWSQTLHTVLDNGPSSNRIDLVFLGDGYLSTQLDTLYAGHVQEELDYLFSGAYRNPFPRYANFFNAHRISQASNETGADRPPENIFRDTAFDASYWWNSIERCLYMDTFLADQAVAAALAGTGIDVDARLGLVNDAKYGGCGGEWAVYAAGHKTARDIGVHELGHSLGWLADEYFSAGNHFSGPEPTSVNLTQSPATGKWDRWVGYDDPDTDIGQIDYYEGGGYHDTGIYRPSFNSEMRSLLRPFDAISREQFIYQFYQEVDPLDDWLDSTSTLVNPDQVWVDPVDPEVIEVEWRLDGDLLTDSGASLDIDSLGLSPGQYTVEARAYDGILDHSFSGDSLDWWRRSDTALLEQFVSWTLEIEATNNGDFNADGIYDCLDIDALVQAVATANGNLDFDLNGDGQLNAGDVNAWLAEAGNANLASGNPYLYGDANLDGDVDALDWNIWNSHKFTTATGWCVADFDANGLVDGSDFNRWNSNKFKTADVVAAAVPEPTGWISLGLVLAGLVCRRRAASRRHASGFIRLPSTNMNSVVDYQR